MQRQRLSLGDGEWWAVDVEVPSTAAVLNFVMVDSAQQLWDNNNYKDFYTGVSGALDAQALEFELIRLLEVSNVEMLGTNGSDPAVHDSLVESLTGQGLILERSFF